MSNTILSIRPVRPADRAWIDSVIAEAFGASVVVSRGQALRPSELDGFVADVDGTPAGLVTLHVDERGCEIVTLNSLRPGGGIGRALMARAEEYARGHECGRLWLITTNDNTRALRIYQQMGMRLVALYPGAVDEARSLKPEIPVLGEDGIAIHDEIELAKNLTVEQ
jgi:ribosomal protein S18 acetylase RimI-like enzyme